MTQTTLLARAALSFSALFIVACASPADSSSHGEAVDSLVAGIEACPVMGGAPAGHFTGDGRVTNADWWPNQLSLEILDQNSAKGNPLGADFDYAEEFAKLDLAAIKKDLTDLLTDSQDWWPADWGNYGGLFIRMAWHSSGTYRSSDGRGGASDGTQRFAPLNSWPDNGNLDKARRLLWPIKKKYGQKISWADLMILAGNCALESAGFETMGFGGGREDVWEPQQDVYWGSEHEWLADTKRYSGERDLENPLAAVQMGLIYVNPEGPGGNPDPLLAAHDIRETFARMGMNDEETVALIAGGHTIGKSHGAAPPAGHVGPAPEGASIEEQGLGWTNSFGTGKGGDTITSGLEGAWTSTPIDWSSGFLDNLYRFEWKLTKTPAGAHIWVPADGTKNVPDAHDPSKRNAPIMLTTDLSLRVDPIYGPISKRFQENPEAFDAAFASAWYKLTHRDMGPATRSLGSEVAAPQIWQDPIPAVDHELVGMGDIAGLKAKVLGSGLSVSELVSTAWASASSFRDSDKRGGANGARLRLAPQKDWAANNPRQLAKVLGVLESIQAEFNAAQTGGKRISLADMLVLAGNAAIESAASKGGLKLELALNPGRMDASAEQTDAASFAVLEPAADGFRNYVAAGTVRRAEELLVDRANQLALSAPEMTALLGGMRVLDTGHAGSRDGVFTKNPGTLSNDFFVNLLSMETEWSKAGDSASHYNGRSRKSGQLQWTATSVDLIFGFNSQLRALAEVYASDDAGQKFADDFGAAWTKVMNLDRF